MTYIRTNRSTASRLLLLVIVIGILSGGSTVHSLAASSPLSSVPYIHQVCDTPQDFNGTWACAPTSAVMVLAHYKALNRTSPRYVDPADYVSRPYSIDGYTFDTSSYRNTADYGGVDCGIIDGQGAWGYIWRTDYVFGYLSAFLELHGVEVDWHPCIDAEAAEALVRNEIDHEHPLIARTYLTDPGHYVVVVGYAEDGNGDFLYLVNDPFGAKPYGTYCWGDNDPQPVAYTHSDMRLDVCGNSPRGLITTNYKGSGTDFLAREQGQIDVFWVQNDRRYHVIDQTILSDMCSINCMPGWDQVTSLSSTDLFAMPEGPHFIAADSQSDGLLIRQQGDAKVYLVEAGKRRWIERADLFVQRGYDWSDVIDVTSAIMDRIPVGSPVDDEQIDPNVFFYLLPTKSSFQMGDTQEKWVLVTTGGPSPTYAGRVVHSYVRVTRPDGQGGTEVRYAYYPSTDFDPSDPLQFTPLKTPLYPGTWSLQDSRWHWDTYVFNGSEHVGTWTWEFWYEDASTGETLLWDSVTYSVPQKLEITSNSVTPTTVSPGEEISFMYTITNPSANAIEAGSVRLGAQIRKSNPVGEWIDHYDGDRSPPINAGVHEYSRPFQIPPNNNNLQSPEPGLYDVRWVLVDNSTGEWIDEKVINNAITVTAEFPPVEPSYGSISGRILSGGTETGLSGANITLSGAASRSTSTDANGNYTFTGLAGGTYTITPSKAGYAFQPPYRIVTIVSDSGASSAAKAATGVAFVGTATTNCQPAPPTNLTTSVQSARRIDLTWNDVGNETEYAIYRSSAGGSYVPIDVVEANITAYQNVALSANTEHCYKIKAQNSCGSSSFSNESCATTLPDASSDPYILLSQGDLSITAIEGNTSAPSRTVSLTNGGGGSLDWSAVSNAPWLEVSPATGTAPSELAVDLDLGGVGPGIYEGRVEITCPTALNTPVGLMVELEVFPEAYYSLSWTDHGDMPEAEKGMASAVLFNKLFLIGVGGFRVCHSYDPVSGTWDERQSLPTEQGVSEGGAVVIENEIYVIADNCPVHDPAVKIYDPLSDSWRFGADIPSPQTRRGVAVAAVNGKLYAIGGSDASLSYSLDDVDEYNPSTDTWTARASMPTPRGYSSVAVVDGLIYVIGGADFADASSPACSEVEVYDPVQNSWNTAASLPRTSIFGAIAGVIDGDIYVVGGRKGNDYKDTVYRYFPDEDRWNLETPTLLTPRGYAAGGVIGGDLFILGGWKSFGDVFPLSSIEKGSQVVANRPPNPASCVTPSQLATGVSTDTDLSWQGDDPDSGDNVSYNVYFGSQGESGNDPPLVAEGVADGTYTLDPLSYSTNYSWKVVSRDSHGATTRSDVFFFETETCPAPGSPVLEDPGEQCASGEYTLAWSEVAEASSYIVEVDDSSGFNTPSEIYDGSATSFTCTDKQDGAYYYRVKAISCAEGNWSNTEDIIIDTVPPTGGVVINDDEESTASLIVTLSLNAGDQEGSGVAQMRLSNDSGAWTSWESFAGTKSDWDLSTVGGNANVGVKALYVQYKDEAGNESPSYTDNIDYDPTSEGAAFLVSREGDVHAKGAFYGSAFNTGSADVAEWVSVSESVEPGDVLELDPEKPGHYRKSSGRCSTLAAGVVPTDPGFTLGGCSTDDSLHTTDERALLALVGIVPVKVTDEGGPIQPGDLLVSSSTPGYAMRWDPDDGSPCYLVGKALELLVEETGVILALLTAH